MTFLFRNIKLMAMAGGLIALTSCAGMDDMQQKMLSGGAAGAVIGTVGIAMTGGCIPCGTAIGGAVGTASGYLMDQLDKSTKSSTPVSSNYTPSQNYSGYNSQNYANTSPPPAPSNSVGGMNY
jgi:hypothetical protein